MKGVEVERPGINVSLSNVYVTIWPRKMHVFTFTNICTLCQYKKKLLSSINHLNILLKPLSFLCCCLLHSLLRRYFVKAAPIRQPHVFNVKKYISYIPLKKTWISTGLFFSLPFSLFIRRKTSEDQRMKRKEVKRYWKKQNVSESTVCVLPK